jgi:hypothetical protein
MSWKRPPKVTDIEVSRDPPFVRLCERRVGRREKAVATGLFLIFTSVGLVAGATAVPVLTAAIAGYLFNDWLNWEYQYGHPSDDGVSGDAD